MTAERVESHRTLETAVAAANVYQQPLVGLLLKGKEIETEPRQSKATALNKSDYMLINEFESSRDENRDCRAHSLCSTRARGEGKIGRKHQPNERERFNVIMVHHGEMKFAPLAAVCNFHNLEFGS